MAFRKCTALLIGFALTGCTTTSEQRDGFVPLFDGNTLDGWRGDPALWSVRDGAIVGAATTRLDAMTFLIREGEYSDFELHFRYRISDGGNSGVQFRSSVADEGKFLVGGYQANVVPADQEVRFAMLYENLGRREIGLLSEQVVISSRDGNLARDVRGSVNPVKTLLGTYRRAPEWNNYVVIAYGNRIVHAVNGYLVLDAIDQDPKAARSGVFALQIDNFGTPMQVEFKDIAVKRLAAAPEIAGRFISAPGPAETTSAIPPRPRSVPR